MMARLRLCAVLGASILTAASARAGGQSPGVQSVAVRELTSPDARSESRFGGILGVRELPDGRLLVNDGRSRQLVLLDRTLANRTIVLDSSYAGGQTYGRRGVPLLPYRGDSSLFVDIASPSLLLIAPNGVVASAIAPPIPAHIAYLAGANVHTDPDGNLVYWIEEDRPKASSRDTALLRKSLSPADSYAVVRVRMDDRRIDTIGRIKAPSPRRVSITLERGRAVASIREDPLPSQDAFAVLSDGSIAFLRSQDYHVEILRPDGQRVVGPKLPFDWKRVTDEDKRRMLDSARAKEQEGMAAIRAASSSRTAAPTVSAKAPNAAAGSSSAAPSNAIEVERQYGWVTPDEMADYYPPIRAGALKADLHGNLWVLPTTSAQSKAGELVYDVVDNSGVLAYRVRFPAGRSVAGFGAGDVVYLMSREATGWVLERTRLSGR